MNLLEQISRAFDTRLGIEAVRDEMRDLGYPDHRLAEADAMAERQDKLLGDLVRDWERDLPLPVVPYTDARVVSGDHGISPEEITARYIAAREGLRGADEMACAVIEAAFLPVLEYGDCYGEH